MSCLLLQVPNTNFCITGSRSCKGLFTAQKNKAKRSLHCVTRQLRPHTGVNRSEVEEKTSGRFGRDDRFSLLLNWLDRQANIFGAKLTDEHAIAVAVKAVAGVYGVAIGCEDIFASGEGADQG